MKNKKTLRLKLHLIWSVSTTTGLCLHESSFSKVADFLLTHAHPTFVYKLNINNHKTVSNEKDMNKAKVKLTHIVGPTMCADKSWTIWHPISTLCKRVWLTWSHKRTCQDNFYPRNSPLISPLLPQTGTDFAHTSRTAFLTCWWYICF